MAYAKNTAKNTAKNSAKNTAKNTAKNSAKFPQSWKDVSGRMVVFGHDNGKFIAYTTAISRKCEHGYEDIWLSVIFPKGETPDIDERFDIDMKGFLSVRVWDDKNGRHTVPCVYVQEYELIEE